MSLTPEQIKALTDAAHQAGIDPAEVIQAAEQELAGQAQPSADASKEPSASGRPIAERMLIGFLPFLTVNEFRQGWLGLDPIKGGEVSCTEWQLAIAAKYGTSTPSSGEPEE